MDFLKSFSFNFWLRKYLINWFFEVRFCPKLNLKKLIDNTQTKYLMICLLKLLEIGFLVFVQNKKLRFDQHLSDKRSNNGSFSTKENS